MFQQLTWLNYSFWAALDDAFVKAFRDYSEGLTRMVKKS